MEHEADMEIDVESPVGSVGRPIIKNAGPKKIRGAERTEPVRLSLNMGYRTAEAAKKTAPKT